MYRAWGISNLEVYVLPESIPTFYVIAQEHIAKDLAGPARLSKNELFAPRLAQIGQNWDPQSANTRAGLKSGNMQVEGLR
jgi:hypothetical protein